MLVAALKAIFLKGNATARHIHTVSSAWNMEESFIWTLTSELCHELWPLALSPLSVADQSHLSKAKKERERICVQDGEHVFFFFFKSAILLSHWGCFILTNKHTNAQEKMGVTGRYERDRERCTSNHHHHQTCVCRLMMRCASIYFQTFSLIH